MKIGDIVENKEDVQVLSFDKDKRVRFSNISDYIKHKLDSKLMEVTTRTGRKIKVTDYHSLFSFVHGRLVDVPTNELIPGESYIAVPKNLNLPREDIKEINLYDYFKTDKDIFVGNTKEYLIRAKKILGLEIASKILNVSKKYFADIAGKNLPVNIINFDKLISEAKLSIDFNEIKLKFKGSKHSYSAMFKVDKNFWRLVGVWIAEGDFNSDTVRIHNQNPEIREDIENICKNYGFKISEMDSCISINSYFLQKVFKKVLGLKSGAFEKNLPGLSFVLDKPGKANLLKGYFSGDGSIYEAERGKFKIEASTVSKALANDLLYLLLDFGIVASCYNRKSNISNKDIYRISILGVKNFEKFIEVGFIDEVRNKRILQYINSRKWARSDILPLSGELYNLASSQSSVYSTNNSIGKDALKNMLILVDKEKTKYKEYWDLVDGDIYFDLVKEVKVIDREDYVYDIEVPDENNFVGGFGGVFAHNSEEGMRKIFERARQVAPCVIFFDEIDSLAGKRGIDYGNKVTERVLNQMLAEMDGLEDLKDILVIGATNRPDMLDPALLRPGRFDKILLVNAPDSRGRLNILKIHTQKMPFGDGKKLLSDKEKESLLKGLLERTEGYTGADIESLAREAALLSLRESIDAKFVTMQHFEEALRKVKPSITKSTIEVYKKIEDSFFRSAKAAVPLENSYLG
ncbi:MAG: AAA family ATPase [Nanoarchaeota archaeon]